MNKTPPSQAVLLHKMIKNWPGDFTGPDFGRFKAQIRASNLERVFGNFYENIKREQPSILEALHLSLYQARCHNNKLIERKLNQAMAEFVRNEDKKKEAERQLLRDRKPARRIAAFCWHQPMPWNHQGPPCYGYVQVTGCAPDRIEDFMKSIQAQPCGKLPTKGRGRKPSVYPVSINLKVLNQWLGHWMKSTEAAAAVLLEQIQLLAITPMPTEETERQFRKLLGRHAKRIIPNAPATKSIRGNDQQWFSYCDEQLDRERKLLREQIKVREGMAAFILHELSCS